MSAKIGVPENLCIKFCLAMMLMLPVISVLSTSAHASYTPPTDSEPAPEDGRLGSSR
jgi:hypothetical protein